MLALTLIQPWATCIAHGPKRVENRAWGPHVRTPFKLAIHAGKAPIDAFEHEDIRRHAWPEIPRHHTFPAGAVVAVATVVAVVSPEARPGDVWAFGPYCWVLEDVRALDRPVPCRGNRRLWALPDDVERQVRAQIAGAP